MEKHAKMLLSSPKELGVGRGVFWEFYFLNELAGTWKQSTILSPEYQLVLTPLFAVIFQTCVIHQLGKEGKEKDLQMVLSSGPLYCQEGGKGPEVLADCFPQTLIDNCLTI